MVLFVIGWLITCPPYLLCRSSDPDKISSCSESNESIQSRNITPDLLAAKLLAITRIQVQKEYEDTERIARRAQATAIAIALRDSQNSELSTISNLKIVERHHNLASQTLPNIGINLHHGQE